MRQLSIATWDYDRVRAITDGRVAVNGFEASYTVLPPEECFRRAWATHEFDVTELGLCTYLTKLSQDASPYVAIPIFTSRAFRHAAIYIRDDRGIETAEDLRGKRIGVPFYEMAAAVWVRGFLKDDFGVTPESIDWRHGGLNSPGQTRRVSLNLPTEFPLRAIAADQTLSHMLAEGALDGIVTAHAPLCFDCGHANVRRLFPDYRQKEVDFFGRTGIFPIMHVLGIRRTLVNTDPTLPAAVFAAFVEAKRIADADLREVAAPKIGLPWIAAETEATERIMGPNFWPYGVDGNVKTLETAARYAHDQGLTSRLIGVDEMFGI